MHSTEGYKHLPPGIIHQEKSSFSDAKAATQHLLQLGKDNPKFLTTGANWKVLEEEIPGASLAGGFVEIFKIGKNLRARAGSGETFFLPSMIHYDLTNRSTGLLKDLPPEFSGEARSYMIALIGGQIMQIAHALEVPFERGMDLQSTFSDPVSLNALFKTSYNLSIPLYDGGPKEYQRFMDQFREVQDTLISSEDKVRIAHIISDRKQKEKFGRVEEYRIASEMMLEVVIEKLQQLHERPHSALLEGPETSMVY